MNCFAAQNVILYANDPRVPKSIHIIRKEKEKEKKKRANS